ncbi:methyl-accepting chemotaxis protein [Lachnoclostridium sp.]|nr:methyl-accepting chemotaxis protein [Lachnoclostridium sp.]
MQKNKIPKRKKLERQILFRFMLVMTTLFLIIGIWATSYTFKHVTNLANSVFDSVITGLTGNIDQFELKNLMEDDSKESEALDTLKTEIGKYSENISVISDCIALITKDNEDFVYLYGLEDGVEYSKGDKLTFVESELVDAYETGEIHNTTLTVEYLWHRKPIDFYFPITTENQRFVIHTTIKTDLITVLILSVLGVFAVLLILILLAVYTIVRIVLKSEMKIIGTLVEKVDDISNLEGDLTKRIHIKSNNEIGLLAEHINKLLDTVHNLVTTIKESSDYLMITTKSFQEMMEKTAAKTDGIQTAVGKSEDAIGIRTEATQKVNHMVAQINDSINQAACRTEQATEEAIKTSNAANVGFHVMKDMKQHMQHTMEQVSDTGNKVEHLKIASQQISSIVLSIRAIAKQTNLIALNASIEAARAGEYGKGFLVVADEVRKLAEESSIQVTSIESLIQSIQERIYETEESMQQTLHTIDDESKMVSSVEEHFSEIAESITSVSDMVQEVSGETQEISASIDNVNSEMSSLNISFTQSDTVIAQMIDNIEEQNTDVQGLAEQVEKLNLIAGQLNHMISKIKL